MNDEIMKKWLEFQEFYMKLQQPMKTIEIDYSTIEIECIETIAINNQLTAKDLKDIKDIDRGFLSRVLKTLENKNILKRTQSKSDKRVYYLKLTKKGKQSYQEIKEKKYDILNKMFNHLTKEQLDLFTDLLLDSKNIYNKVNIEPQTKKFNNIINEEHLTYIKNNNQGVWQVRYANKTIASLLFSKQNQWSAELSLIKTKECANETIKNLLEFAIEYAEVNYIDHLYLFDDIDTEYNDVYATLEFICTETLGYTSRFDLFLSFV